MGRDRTCQAILPLWGKMLNVEKTRIDKIIGNDKLQPVISSLGAGHPARSSTSKSCAITRSSSWPMPDVDGSHIRTLLLTFFYRYMTPLIEKGLCLPRHASSL